MVADFLSKNLLENRERRSDYFFLSLIISMDFGTYDSLYYYVTINKYIKWRK